MVKNLVKEYWPTGLGVAVGALGGWLYYFYIGCANGTCPITSSPLMSVLWGALMGGLLFNSFQKQEKK